MLESEREVHTLMQVASIRDRVNDSAREAAETISCDHADRIRARSSRDDQLTSKEDQCDTNPVAHGYAAVKSLVQRCTL